MILSGIKWSRLGIPNPKAIHAHFFGEERERHGSGGGAGHAGRAIGGACALLLVPLVVGAAVRSGQSPGGLASLVAAGPIQGAAIQLLHPRRARTQVSAVRRVSVATSSSQRP
jgi:hypothetical protein